MEHPKQNKKKKNRGGRGGNRSMNRDDIRVSKKLSYFLRHGAVDHKINIRPDGFVYLDELLKKGKLKARFEQIQRIVQNNDKKRFEMVKDDVEPFGWKIRAVQGHTLRMVDQDKLLTRIGRKMAGILKYILLGNNEEIIQ